MSAKFCTGKIRPSPEACIWCPACGYGDHDPVEGDVELVCSIDGEEIGWVPLAEVVDDER
jgi:hypothetical protein